MLVTQEKHPTADNKPMVWSQHKRVIYNRDCQAHARGRVIIKQHLNDPIWDRMEERSRLILGKWVCVRS